jgi:hypothetical protein
MNFPYAPFLIEARSQNKPLLCGKLYLLWIMPSNSRPREHYHAAGTPLIALDANMAETRENSNH